MSVQNITLQVNLFIISRTRCNGKKSYLGDMEIWKAISGYEGLYEVSDSGKIRSVTHTINRPYDGSPVIFQGRILRPSKSSIYLHVALCKDGKATTKRIHRIVAEAFIPNPENKPHVNHLDGNPHNNCLDNLERATVSENLKHSYKFLGRESPMKGRYGSSNVASKAVLCTTSGETYESAMMAERALSLPRGKVTAVCRGERNHTKNLHFKFV